MNIDIKNKIVIITGGSSGIGKSLVKCFANEGCFVFFTYLNNKDSSEKLVSELTADGKKVECCKVDNSNSNEIKAFISSVIEKCGKIDVLINNAGYIPRGLFLNTPIDVIEKAVNVNLIGTANYCQAVLKNMMINKGGCIINISSISALRPVSGQSAYSVSKAGIESLTSTLAQEYGKYNIRINTIAPGLIETDVVKSITQKKKDNILNMTPMGKNGSPDDIANAAVFLASDKASHITGIQLLVTGGRHLM